MKVELLPVKMNHHETVTNCRMDNGRMSVSLLSYGAAIQGLWPEGFGGRNVVLSFENPGSYRDNPLYAGAVLGPNAGRLSGAGQLTCNDGANQLHGGSNGLSFRNWSVENIQETDDTCSVTFSCRLRDGVDGYPGNRCFTVCYTLCKENCFAVHLHAVTDRPTYVNMSHHPYFNLSGDFTSSVLGHRLQIDASRYTLLRPDYIPSGIAECCKTPFDFSVPRTMSEQAEKYPRHPQLEIGRGYNHGFLLNHSQNKTGMEFPGLVLAEPQSSRQMSVFTDAPCIVVYSGGFIGNDLTLAGKVCSSASCAAAIECQDIPDTPSLFPTRMNVITPTAPFHRTIVYRFEGSSNTSSHSIQQAFQSAQAASHSCRK